MKKLCCILLLAALCLSLAACGESREPLAGEGPLIVTTVFPAYEFARQIAGEDARVQLLVSPGAESHSFEPTARDLLRIRESDLFFYNGGESEVWVEELLAGQDAPGETLRMMDCVETLEEEEKEGMQQIHGEEEEEEGPEYDEHVWTYPPNAIRICTALCQRLCLIDPERAELYQDNLEAYVLQLQDLDQAFRQVISAGSGDTLIFADRFPARYFTEGYGLDYYAAFPGCTDDTEPSAKTVAFLIDRVREKQIPAVLYVEFSNEKMADVVAEDTSCGKRLFHSCHTVSPQQLAEGVTYLELMWANVDAVKEALG